jgi:hypothetical protein
MKQWGLLYHAVVLEKVLDIPTENAAPVKSRGFFLRLWRHAGEQFRLKDIQCVVVPGYLHFGLSLRTR